MELPTTTTTTATITNAVADVARSSTEDTLTQTSIPSSSRDKNDTRRMYTSIYETTIRSIDSYAKETSIPSITSDNAIPAIHASVPDISETEHLCKPQALSIIQEEQAKTFGLATSIATIHTVSSVSSQLTPRCVSMPAITRSKAKSDLGSVFVPLRISNAPITSVENADDASLLAIKSNVVDVPRDTEISPGVSQSEINSSHQSDAGEYVTLKTNVTKHKKLLVPQEAAATTITSAESENRPTPSISDRSFVRLASSTMPVDGYTAANREIILLPDFMTILTSDIKTLSLVIKTMEKRVYRVSEPTVVECEICHKYMIIEFLYQQYQRSHLKDEYTGKDVYVYELDDTLHLAHCDCLDLQEDYGESRFRIIKEDLPLLQWWRNRDGLCGIFTSISYCVTWLIFNFIIIYLFVTHFSQFSEGVIYMISCLLFITTLFYCSSIKYTIRQYIRNWRQWRKNNQVTKLILWNYKPIQRTNEAQSL